MPESKLARFIVLPELKLRAVYKQGHGSALVVAEKVRPTFEVCPKCAQPSSALYDRRLVKLRDAPIHGSSVYLKIHKHRYYCKTCKKPFTEPLVGVMPRRRTTQRYRRSLLWACENFSDLSKVRRAYRCSSQLMYTVFYEQLELKLREKQNPWPSKIGIDEHFFSRKKGYSEFVTVTTDMVNKRVREVALGKAIGEITPQFAHIEGRENVRQVVCDLADTYRSFAKQFFPNAQIVADKFHVLRLLSPHIMRKRKEITGSNADRRARKLLLMSSKKLDYFDRKAIWTYLQAHPELAELYQWKERIHTFYRIQGYNRAKIALNLILDKMALSQLSEIKTLRRTLQRWSKEILNYFNSRLTNARTEGFNNVAKLVQKRAYGYKSFRNYRLRLLSACA